MLHNFFANRGYGYHVFITFIIAFASFGVFMFIGFLSAVFIWDLQLAEIEHLLNPYAEDINVSILKYFQILQSLGLFIFSSFFILMYFYRGKGKDFILINRKPSTENIVLSILIIIFILPFINFLGEINSNLNLPDFLEGLQGKMERMERDAARLTEVFLKIRNPFDFWINLFMIAVLPAIGEELLFRGILQRQLAHWFKNYHLGILVSAVLFSAMHMQFFGFLPRLALGVLFGYMAIWSGNLWLPIIAHFVNNSMAVIVYSYFYDTDIVEKMDSIGTAENMIGLAIFSLMISGSVLYFLYLRRKKDVYGIIPDKQY